ncbi:gamma-glutamylcyclotransferase family protein [Heliorestis convoluta]|uniref:Gamma-glutamylcyclotransferase, AIG2-like protein n=1 Tax=Heliorestis convoluta TaxID=356322 RepID=A0A5Q2N1F2_9FIRM|nr:gamma-glutamylcyclotransferase family protein [Heliorestis convoluta]QGG47643.1 gamma-glutamylcyclotransferase, AIG2-like protein [Heliorestis convoluta]
MFYKKMKKRTTHLPLLYFAYGSNLHKEQMQIRCPDSVPLCRATVYDYILTFRGNRRGVGVADIIPTNKSQVEGALYRVSLRDLRNLDRYEGYPTLYRRYPIEVETEDGIKEAFVYRMNEEFTFAPPYEKYFHTISEGYDHWGINEEDLLTARQKVTNLILGKKAN